MDRILKNDYGWSNDSSYVYQLNSAEKMSGVGSSLSCKATNTLHALLSLQLKLIEAK